MTTVLYILGYILMIAVVAFGAYKFGEEKEEALALGVMWPLTLFFGLVILLCLPIWWLGEKIIDLWDMLERK